MSKAPALEKSDTRPKPQPPGTQGTSDSTASHTSALGVASGTSGTKSGSPSPRPSIREYLTDEQVAMIRADGFDVILRDREAHLARQRAYMKKKRKETKA